MCIYFILKKTINIFTFRKKVQDFYQRSSLTAYCSAFAYRPLSHGVNSCLSKVYLELPADSKHLYTPHRSPTPPAWDPRCKGILGRFHSTGKIFNDAYFALLK